MASNYKMATAAVNAQADALSDLLDNGYLRIYDGSQPATADTAIDDQVLLAELRLGNPFSGAAVAGVLTAGTITKDSSANASGTAAWFRLLQSDGTTPVLDGSVGTADADLILGSVEIAAGAEVSVTAYEHTVTKG